MKPQVVIITGVSGSGKTTAMKALEDFGYYCVDNLPVGLIPNFLELCESASEDISKVALVVDVRERRFLKDFTSVYEQLREKGFEPIVVYLDATNERIKARFKETRRRHPLLEGFNMDEVLEKEREVLAPIRALSHVQIDTSDINIHQLRDRLRKIEGITPSRTMQINIISFGYKYGVPSDADLVIDVRCLPNPFFKEDLRNFNGNDERVKEYVLKNKMTEEFLQRLTAFLDYAVDLYEKEGKSILNLAFGCTGGKHRSVVMANYFDRYLRERTAVVSTFHRDIEK